MRSKKPYVIPAYYQWICDSHCTPILVIHTSHPELEVPPEFLENDEILFNISKEAVREFEVFYDRIQFRASFSGVIQFISVPLQAVLAIYAEENGAGYYFDAEDNQDEDEGDLGQQMQQIDNSASASANNHRKPILKLVE